MSKPFALACLLFGCQPVQGPPGPQGEAGPPGAPGERGPAGLALQWFDATGARMGPDLAVLAQGVRWPLDPETGEIVLAVSPRAFESSDCTGPAFAVEPPLPRIAFLVAGELEAPRVRGDGARAPVVTLGSVRGEQGACNATSITRRAVRVDTLMPLTLAVSVFVPPFHLETR